MTGGSFIPSKEDLENPCVVCNAVYNGIDNMVQCGKCNAWFHYKCAGNPTIKTNKSWYCNNCKIKLNEEKKQDDAVKKESARKIQSLEEKLAAQKDDIEKLMEMNAKLMEQLNHGDGNGASTSGIKRKSNLNEKSKVNSTSDESDEDISSKSRERMKSKSSTHSRNSRKLSVHDSSTDDDEDEDDGKVCTRAQMAKYIAQQEHRDLPCFDGSAIQWPTFVRSYKDSQKFFSNVGNRNRLQKALKGKALKAVSGLLLSPSTINEAVKVLEFRFGKSEQIIQEAIDQALSAEQPNEKKPDTIVDYAMLVLTIKANIVSVGDESDIMNPMLIKLLAERLPLSMQKSWSRRKREVKEKNRLVSVSTFSKWLMKESEDYVDMIPAHLPEGKKNSKIKTTINLHQEQSTTPEKESKNATKQPLKKKKPMVCFKCSSNEHQIQDCEEFKQMTMDQRVQFVKANYLCLVCLKRGHRWFRCFNRNSKGGRTFHDLVNNVDEKGTNSQSTDDKIETTLSHYTGNEKRATLFKIVPVTLHGPISQLTTFALLDECASSTLIEDDIAKRLNLVGPVVPLLMGWTKEITNLEEQSMQVKLGISAVGNHSERYTIKNVRTVKHLSLPTQCLNPTNLRKNYPYLKDVDLVCLKNAIPTILIGLDNTNLIAPLEILKDPSEIGPVAVRTKLGWTVHGPEVHGNNLVTHPTFLICECNRFEEERVDSMVEKYFSQEDFGVKLSISQSESPENKTALDILEKTTRRDGNIYETGLLWRTKSIVMPNNFSMCFRRLISVEHKMKMNPIFGEAYKMKIEDYVNKKYAKKLSEEEYCKISNNMWLLPHFGVSTVSKPKLRLVFDAKATYCGVSLNSCLLSGPDQYNSIVGVLFKFREGEFAVAADVREMFHMVKIREEDRRFQCFLWRNGDASKKPDIYMMLVMIFGATCSPCSAQYIKNRNAMEFIEKYPRAVEGILKKFYVDDYMDSFKREDEALQIVRQVIDINSKANFDLRNIISNSSILMNQFSSKSKTSIINMNVEKESSTEKVLGLFWDTKTDSFLYKPQFKINDGTNKHPTKRSVLRILMSIFDPLGLLAHYVVRAKILLQDMWINKSIEWDTPLPNDLSERWSKWLNELIAVEKLRIPRNYSKILLHSDNIQLHLFTDASERAFSSVAYVRVVLDGVCHVALMSAKSKVPSIKTNKVLSIPRLELQGAILGVRLANFIQKEHCIKFQSVHYWSDSQTVLSWITTEHGSFKPFVAHRIAEILDTTTAAQWRYISSKINRLPMTQQK